MAQPGTRPTVRLILGVLAIIALALFWHFVWSDLDRTVLTRVPILDEAYYLREAAEISGGQWLPDDPFIMSPLYPYLVAATGGGREIGPDQVRIGPPPYGTRILQVLLWLGTAVLLWQVARRHGPVRFAWMAPVLWLLYRPGAVFASSTLLEVPLTFLVVAALATATSRSALSCRWALAAGALVGAAALLRFHAVLLIVPVVWALLGAGDEPVHWRSWRRGAPAVLALLLLVLPVSVFNSVKAGRLAGPSLNGGINLYIGNGPEANGFFVTYRGFDAQADPSGRLFLSQRLGADIHDVAAADRAWTREAWRAVSDDPFRALGLWLKKLRLHFVDAEFSQISPLDSWAREAPALKLLPVPYGVVAAGGLLGLFLLGLRDKRLRPWAIALLLLIAAQSVFFVVSRYRLILVPMLALFTSVAVSELWARRGRHLAVGVGLIIVCVLAVLPWGLDSSLRRLEAAGLVNEGVRWEHLGDDGEQAAHDRALSLYRSALELDPAHPETYRAMARVQKGRGRLPESEDTLRRGLTAADPVDDVRRDLIALLLSDDRPDEAVDLMREHLSSHPEDTDMMHNYAVALAGIGHDDEAEVVAKKFMVTAPDDPRGYIDLGVIVARQGRLEEARAIFGEGLKHNPNDTRLLDNLDRIEILLVR